MKLRTLFAVDAVVSFLLALVLLLGPSTLLKFLGLSQGKTEVLLAQVLGAALIGYGALAWFGKDVIDSQSLRGTMAAMLSFNAIGFVVTLLGVMAQVTRAGGAWLLVVVFLVFTAGYAYFQFAGPRE